MTENMPMMDARGLFCIYEGLEQATNVVALKGIDLKMKHGEFVAVVGSSGAGKSSLLRILGGLQHPSAGSLKYYGNEITRLSEDELVPFRRSTVGFIFQEGNLLPELSAFQNVVNTMRYAGVGYNDARKRASELLNSLDLRSRMHALPHRLSGGEQQRVSIARALANKPALILADEPTGNLDYANTDHVMHIFKDLHKEMDTGFLVVTHSQHVASYADRSVELRDGMIIGQHGIGTNIYDLASTRAVVISDAGHMTIPPELMPVIRSIGMTWEFSFEMENSKPKIVGTPVSMGVPTVFATSSDSEGETIKHCPVCNKQVKDEFFCNSCGAKLK